MLDEEDGGKAGSGTGADTGAGARDGAGTRDGADDGAAQTFGTKFKGRELEADEDGRGRKTPDSRVTGEVNEKAP